MADCIDPDPDVTTDLSNVVINANDGLPNVNPESSMKCDSSTEHTDDEFDDLPTSIIVTSIQDEVFASPELKEEMENLFRQFGKDVTFQWLRSFRRLRVNYTTPVSAAQARVQLHQYRINESVIHCYFAQPITPVKVSSLQPPAPHKQFLISPPASPPLDWEPRPENEPLVNHDLLAAIANLAPGGSHELHSPAPGQPGIVVHGAAASAQPPEPGIIST